ncbi:MAG: hypothetical protein KAX38_02005 [Candidatus Krumholzibacteria bacterium]|nr:hypothetical protein [Candidatus Krumholzibacteria bacterium]
MSSVKNRIKILLVASTLTVALAFGFSFYFALLSNESAIAMKVPELETVVSKLKNLLVINTFAFIAIIIASFYALSALITSKMFYPLGTTQVGLIKITEGMLPMENNSVEEGPFSSFDTTFKAAISALREKENSEIKELVQCLTLISDPSTTAKVQHKLEKIVKSKNTFLGLSDHKETGIERDKESDSLFMQPT